MIFYDWYPSNILFAVSICAWFLKCQFGSLLQTRKKNRFRNSIFFRVWTLFLQATQAVKIKFELDKKSSFEIDFFFRVWNWKKIEWHSIFRKSSGDRQGECYLSFSVRKSSSSNLILQTRESPCLSPLDFWNIECHSIFFQFQTREKKSIS